MQCSSDTPMRFILPLHRVLLFLLLLSACDSYTGPENPQPFPDPPKPVFTTADLVLQDSFAFHTIYPVRIYVRVLDHAAEEDRQSRIEILNRPGGDLLSAGITSGGLLDMSLTLPAHSEALFLRRRYAGVLIDSAEVSIGNLYTRRRFVRHEFGHTANNKSSLPAGPLYAHRDTAAAPGAAAVPGAVRAGRSVYPKPGGQVLFFDDMEGGRNGWVHYAIGGAQTDNWSQTTQRAASGQVSWHVAPHLQSGGEALQSPFINLANATSAILTFHHWYVFDDCGSSRFSPDGGRVEISLNNSTWQALKPIGGYPAVLDETCDNPLGGAAVYGHRSDGFATAVFDLSAYAGHPVYLRFRSSWDCDNCTATEGWYIDDVLITDAGADRDGDGVRDEDDTFPLQPGRAFQTWYPSAADFATIICEDSWPAAGDYDFNDLIMKYQYRLICNSDGNVVALNALYQLQAFGTGEELGFAVRFPFEAMQISSFSGSTGTTLQGSGQVSLIVMPNGSIVARPAAGYSTVNTQAGSPLVSTPLHSAVFEFTAPLPMEQMAALPYDPYIFFVNEPNRQIHLPDHPPTPGAGGGLWGQQDDTSNPAEGRFYRTAGNMGWMLHVPCGWQHPLEKSDLLKAYLKFRNWAENQGGQSHNWYLPQSGNISTKHLWSQP